MGWGKEFSLVKIGTVQTLMIWEPQAYENLFPPRISFYILQASFWISTKNKKSKRNSTQTAKFCLIFVRNDEFSMVSTHSSRLGPGQLETWSGLVNFGKFFRESAFQLYTTPYTQVSFALLEFVKIILHIYSWDYSIVITPLLLQITFPHYFSTVSFDRQLLWAKTVDLILYIAAYPALPTQVKGVTLM